MVYVITVHLHANDHPDSVDKIKAKLIEASRVYSKDKETLSWFVMQSTSDPRDFTIVERYEKESVSLNQPRTLFPVPGRRSYPCLPQRDRVDMCVCEREAHTQTFQTSISEEKKTCN